MKNEFLLFWGAMEALGLSADEALDEFMADNRLSGSDPEVIAMISELHAEQVL